MQNSIVACARSYLGTRFHHQGRLKKTATHKGGIDCLGLLTCVAAELHLRGKDGSPFTASDRTDYSHTPDSQNLRNTLTQLLHPIPTQAIQPGDILILNIDESPQHLAIVSPSPLVGGLGWGQSCSENNCTSKNAPHLTSPLMGEELNIIHAYAPARAVVEHPLDDYWQNRIECAFRVES